MSVFVVHVRTRAKRKKSFKPRNRIFTNCRESDVVIYPTQCFRIPSLGTLVSRGGQPRHEAVLFWTSTSTWAMRLPSERGIARAVSTSPTCTAARCWIVLVTPTAC